MQVRICSAAAEESGIADFDLQIPFVCCAGLKINGSIMHILLLPVLLFTFAPRNFVPNKIIDNEQEGKNSWLFEWRNSVWARSGRHV